ncbi:DNA-binding transcriptional regulator, ArsR family [Paraburkholderia unamae]|uniref:ArsR/SmtB family transcription factor n=1 Tax=Paraburkholderia unamae TaxID=219649 RepID=UPI000DC2797E|nr:metalloregulator ArsR/SmtB family transcription factor [Paraburkholderia unamae]RAR56458.1 ArsR family transcriptional regulator [Paraburkholderia unamae]CAG9268247.1 DNA-binding transcriptional regulator, ArsR family [Paraburkholderia unamae]
MRTTPEDFEALQEHASEAAELMRLLGNANRLQLLCQIAQGEQSVGQIEEQLDIKQPALSQQLAELRKAGLVQTRRESRSILYSLGDGNVRRLLELLLVAFRVRTLPQIETPAERAPVAAPASHAGDSARFARVER